MHDKKLKKINWYLTYIKKWFWNGFHMVRELTGKQSVNRETHEI